MKRISILTIAILTLCLANSCNKCATCTIYPGSTRKICRSNYSTDDQYNEAFHQLEAQGYSCHD